MANKFKVGDKVRWISDYTDRNDPKYDAVVLGHTMDGEVQVQFPNIPGFGGGMAGGFITSYSADKFVLRENDETEETFLVLGYIPAGLVKGREAAEEQAMALLEMYPDYRSVGIFKAVSKVERVSSINVTDFN
jgi:hypothetical protein